MRTITICSLTLIMCLFITGCKKKDSSSVTVEQTAAEKHLPASPLYTAKYDYSAPVERINAEEAIADSVPVRLSEIASEIKYYQVGDDKYPVTQVLAVPGGLIALNKPKIYLYRQGMKRKRVGLKTEYSNWTNSPSLYYDKGSGCLYARLEKIDTETGYAINYIGQLPPLDTVLSRTRYLYPDSLPARHTLYTGNATIWDFSSTGYTMPNYYKELINGVSTFGLNGDTLCRFNVGTDDMTKIPQSRRTFGIYSTNYSLNDQPTYFFSYCDTIYRLTDKETIKPVYNIHLGKYRATASYILGGGELQDKAYINGLHENRKGLFINLYQEGVSSKSGWLDEKDTRDKSPESYQVVYVKSSKRTYSLPHSSKGLINDLDDGISFWPDGQTEEYLYMIRPAKELKARVKLTGSARQKELKAFLSDLPDDQNVMVVIK